MSRPLLVALLVLAPLDFARGGPAAAFAQGV
jgi:hypothetical protein